MKDSLLLPNLQCNMLLNSGLFPNFFECSEVVTSKQYKGCPLVNLPITSVLQTRSRTANNPENSTDEFLNGKIEVYQEYLIKLTQNIEKRFHCGTMKFV